MSLTTNGKLHPRICGIALDAMALDKKGGPRDALVDRLLALNEESSIHIIEPGTAYRQMQHPNTHAAVREVMGGQIYSLATGLNQEEQRRKAKVIAIMRGNSTTNRHDKDAVILFEAGKHGCGYFITEDGRILGKKAELEAALGPPLCILPLAEFLPIYDLFVEEEREREKLTAALR
jgi:hypothetical protein